MIGERGCEERERPSDLVYDLALSANKDKCSGRGSIGKKEGIRKWRRE